MPWDVEKTDRCPASRPWGVIREGGELEGCHETEEMANRQRDALYAQEGKTVKHKTFELVETKADGKGTFEALVSVFGNVDHGGDRIVKGAYQKSLERWRESGDPIPIVFSHQWDDPMAHIGVADPRAVMETDRGLLVQGQLDVDDNPLAKQVHKLLKRRSLKEFSIGYSVPKGGEKYEDGVNEISEMELIEAGPTLKGMNDQTELGAVKAAVEELEEAEAEEAEDGVEDAEDEEPVEAKSPAQDPLKKASLATALEVLSDGASLRRYEEVTPEPQEEPPSEDEQFRRFVDLQI